MSDLALFYDVVNQTFARNASTIQPIELPLRLTQATVLEVDVYFVTPSGVRNPWIYLDPSVYTNIQLALGQVIPIVNPLAYADNPVISTDALGPKATFIFSLNTVPLFEAFGVNQAVRGILEVEYTDGATVQRAQSTANIYKALIGMPVTLPTIPIQPPVTIPELGIQVEVTNFPVTQKIEGLVTVVNQGSSNGTVTVLNFPEDQLIHGPVTVTNLTVDQLVHGEVTVASGTISVDNFPTTQKVEGTVEVLGSVEVSNLPADQLIHGPVEVTNFPTTQKVEVVNFPDYPDIQDVNVTNFPVTQRVEGTVEVIGSVEVSNFPVTQKVEGQVSVIGSVEVSNLPITQKVEGEVSVLNFPSVQDVNVTNFPTTQKIDGTVEVLNFPDFPALQDVNVTNFPTTQKVEGTVEVLGSVEVSNLTVDQLIHGPVTVTNFPVTFKVEGEVVAVVDGPIEVSNFPTTQLVEVINFPTTISVNNLPVTQKVEGLVAVTNFPAFPSLQDVNVTNFPADQAVHGSVTVLNPAVDQLIHGPVEVTNFPSSYTISNFPAIQPVNGTVNIGNLPATQTIGGSVAVSNFPVTQHVDGTVSVLGSVAVSNLPADQLIHGSVTLLNPTADQLVHGNITVNGLGTIVLPVTLTNPTVDQLIHGPVTVTGLGTTTLLVQVVNNPATLAISNFPITQPISAPKTSPAYAVPGAFNASFALTRPTNNTPYAVGDLINNTAGTSLPALDLSPFVGVTAREVQLREVWLESSNGGVVSKLQAAVYLFNTATPTGLTLTDNVLFSPNATAMGQVVAVAEYVANPLQPNPASANYLTIQTEMSRQMTTTVTGQVFAAIVTLNAYVPANGEVFTLWVRGLLC